LAVKREVQKQRSLGRPGRVPEMPSADMHDVQNQNVAIEMIRREPGPLIVLIIARSWLAANWQSKTDDSSYFTEKQG
jgi:hypothetical protein